MSRLVVIDDSPLIVLAIVDGLEWLPELFGIVFMPESVRNEVLPGMGANGEEAIACSIEAGWLKVWPELIPAILDIDLDIGETDASIIGMAKKQGLILSARKAFIKLHTSDFRISAAVINQVLLSAKEQT